MSQRQILSVTSVTLCSPQRTERETGASGINIKSIVFTYLSEALNSEATKRPGNPGRKWNTSTTNNGTSCKVKKKKEAIVNLSFPFKGRPYSVIFHMVRSQTSLVAACLAQPRSRLPVAAQVS